MKSNAWRLSLALILWLASLAFAPAADNVTAAFQKALFEEEANQNLEAAIQAYQSVLAQLDQQRKIAATTVFRLGECYRKLGKTNETIAQFQRVVREFSDQEVLAKLSRQNLAALGVESGDKAKKPDLVSIPLQDEEAAEVARIKALIANSPDLINASDARNAGQTPLQQAANKGQLAVARFLLENGADVDAQGREGTPRSGSPLLLAARAGNKTMLELLLSHGAEVDRTDGQGKTALCMAVERGYRSAAETLLAAKADVNSKRNPNTRNIFRNVVTPLDEAISKSDARFVELLLNHGANPNLTGDDRVTALHRAVYVDSAEIAKLLLAKGAKVDASIGSGINEGKPMAATAENRSVGATKSVSCQGFTPLHLAAMQDRVEMAKLLLAHKASVNARASAERTPLNLASVWGSTEMVRLLLDHGAEVNARATDDTSFPLHAAVARKLPDMVDAVLAKKPNVELHDAQGWTPLLRAAGYGEASIVKSLLDAGADPNATLPETVQTPLHFAVNNRSKSIVELLLAHKANVVAVDNAGRTPLDYAKADKASPPEIAELIRSAGGKDDLQRLTSIRVGRAGPNGGYYPVFYKGTNDVNRYRLFESFATFYQTQIRSAYAQLGNYYNKTDTLVFPDFAKVVIRRLSDGGETRIPVDAEAAFQLGDCSRDTLLEWGDIVEIPELDHRLNEPWAGLSTKALSSLGACLSREVRVTVKGKTSKVELTIEQPLATRLQQIVNAGQTTAIPSRFVGTPPIPTPQPAPSAQSKDSEPSPPPIRVSSFRLKEVLYGSNLLLTSSDITRVKVVRVDPSTKERKEMIFDLEKTDPKTDLWLLNGDTIEVPEKE